MRSSRGRLESNTLARFVRRARVIVARAIAFVEANHAQSCANLRGKRSEVFASADAELCAELFEGHSLLAGYTRSEPGTTSFDINNLTGLRSGNHVLEVRVLIDRACRIVALFSFALNATLLFVLLFLFTRLFSAAFFQLVFLWFGLSTWPTLSVPFIAGSKKMS